MSILGTSFVSTPIRQIRELSLSHLRRSCHKIRCNDDVCQDFVNRNPRNLEMLRVGQKPQGWTLDASTKTTKNFWYRLVYEPTHKNINARIEHYSGASVVSVSTQEWAVKQFLYSTSDVSAAENVGRILAHRCLQSGICEVHTDLKEFVKTSEKIRRFLAAFEEGGVFTKEPSYIEAHEMYRWSRYFPTLPWNIIEEEVVKEDKTYEKK